MEWLVLVLAGLVLPACSRTAGMVLVTANSKKGTTKNFYIDAHEASLKQKRQTNSETGEKESVTVAQSRSSTLPASSVNFTEAKEYCQSAEKRLCTKKEWLTACVGPDNLGASLQPTPTNPSIDALCFVNRKSGSSSSTASTTLVKTGSQTKCHTKGLQVFDLVGNVSEWVIDEDSSNAGRAMGANAASRVADGKCEYFVQTDTDNDGIDDTPIDESANEDTIGFRCCLDEADAAE